MPATSGWMAQEEDICSISEGDFLGEVSYSFNVPGMLY